jgi:MFS family permease
VVIIDAVSYFVFAALLSQIPPQPPQHAVDSAAPKTHLGQAFGLLLKNPVLLSTTIMFLLFNVGGGGLLSVWLPILSDSVLKGGAELYGMLLGIMALGEIIGALLAGSRILPTALGSRICAAQALSGLSLLILLLIPQTWGVAIGLMLFGAFSAPLTIWAQTLRMQIIPEQLRGRTFALLRMLMQSGNPIGGALGGLLPITGIPIMIALTAALTSLPGVVGYGVTALRTAGNEVVVPTQIAIKEEGI